MTQPKENQAFPTDLLIADYYAAQKDRYLTFRVDGEEFGVGIRYVREIVGMGPLTAMGDVPSYIRGLICLHEIAVPVMDMRLRFSKEPRDYDDHTSVVVVETDGRILGLAVDAVREVIEIPPDLISPPHVRKSETFREYFCGVRKLGEDETSLLDIERLLQDESLPF